MNVSARAWHEQEKGDGSRDEADADFLVEHLQDLLACTTLLRLVMYLQVLDRFLAALCGSEFHRAIFGQVVFPQFRELQDDVLHLACVDVSAK